MANNEEYLPKSSSEAIIADLLNDVKSSDMPFSVDKLAGCDETVVKHKKRKKHHKHKSKKSKRGRKRSRTWSSSRSRSRSRSRGRSRERKKNTRSRSRSRTKQKEEKYKYKKENTLRNSPLLSEPVVALRSEAVSESLRSFPKKDDLSLGADFNGTLVKKEMKLTINITTAIPKIEEELVTMDKNAKGVEDGVIEDIAHDDPSMPDSKDKGRGKMEEKEIKKSRKNKDRGDEYTEKEKKESERKRKKERSGKTKKRTRTRTNSTSSFERKSRINKENRRYSRSRSNNRYSDYRHSSAIRITSRSRDRQVRSRDRQNEEKPSRWTSHTRERKECDAYKRKRSRSREIIDKEKLLAIAKTKRAEMMSNGDRDNASIEDFVTYCKKLQIRQEREKRREAGQAVSDHDSDGETIRYKHPYAMPKEPIRINIVTAASSSLAQKSITCPEQSSQLGASQLRIVYPVSSGAVHKENAEWIPVEKDDVPKSCSMEQKKHVALTSLEIDRCRAQGIPVAPAPIPKFLNSILPPPPNPPQLLPNPFRPPTPPPLPSVLYVPNKDKMILKEPKEISIPAPSDIGKVLKQRTEAQRKVLCTPNDFDAHRALREANEQISLWAALKSLPGEYTGTTGLKLLTADELQPHNPKFHAWVKKDQFRNAAPATGGIGRLMLEKMGWRPGEGLGKDATGNIEPLVLDVKSDRKGLMAEEEMSIKQRNKISTQNNAQVDLSTKNPISLIMELCAKRRWNPPSFTCEESGADHLKMFIWTVVVNNVEYRPMCGSKQKKEGKAVAAQVALQALGVLPRDSDIPVHM